MTAPECSLEMLGWIAGALDVEPEALAVIAPQPVAEDA